jgi:hypothetical protein
MMVTAFVLAYNNCSTVIGNDLMRRPVAWYTALAMAADRPENLAVVRVILVDAFARTGLRAFGSGS